MSANTHPQGHSTTTTTTNHRSRIPAPIEGTSRPERESLRLDQQEAIHAAVAADRRRRREMEKRQDPRYVPGNRNNHPLDLSGTGGVSHRRDRRRQPAFDVYCDPPSRRSSLQHEPREGDIDDYMEEEDTPEEAAARLARVRDRVNERFDAMDYMRLLRSSTESPTQLANEPEHQPQPQPRTGHAQRRRERRPDNGSSATLPHRPPRASGPPFR